jgi:hypothetical protein
MSQANADGAPNIDPVRLKDEGNARAVVAGILEISCLGDSQRYALLKDFPSGKDASELLEYLRLLMSLMVQTSPSRKTPTFLATEPVSRVIALQQALDEEQRKAIQLQSKLDNTDRAEKESFWQLTIVKAAFLVVSGVGGTIGLLRGLGWLQLPW